MATRIVSDVAQTLTTQPQTLGYLATFWTVALVLTHLLKRGWRVSRATVRRSLHQLDYRWRRPRLAITRRDPEGQARMAAISRAIWQAQPESLDESQFKLLPVLRAMWTIVAHTVHIPTPPYNGSVWAYDAVDIVSGQWLSAVFDRFNAANFVTFLDQIVAACPTGHITLIIDHAPAHTAHKVARWLETQSRVSILFLPKYASHLNPIERIWGVAKNKVVANHCYQTISALRQAVQTFLDAITPAMALQSTGLNV
jgi:transposase